MTDAATLTDLKAAARTAAFARRKAAHAVRTPAAADSLCAELRRFAGRALAGYMPMRTEIDCLPAMAAHDGPVAVPVILGPGQPLRFRRWTPASRMVTGDFGALIPVTGDWIVPEVLVVPLVAFDRRGYRLGYGGGFYDRTLEGLRAQGPVIAIGFAYGAQEMAEVPVEPTDQRLDLIVTEREVIAPGR
ncbi:5-formyltetrahydrofolate cyclo-ligase [Albidovulum sp.]|jgi:5-formyltetrahydrofolate cyclo-ligase|uniref:5-formyltetrahydrofolate cyclo-ligase n=1 Tax=Albidovulum sp. TaxID=1872424 RepID=UPI0039B954E8